MDRDGPPAAVRDVTPFIGVKLHLETDRIRIWEEHFAPREATEAHRHALDYIFVALTDIDLTVDPLPGETPEKLTLLTTQEEASLDGNRGRMPRGTVFHAEVPSHGTAHIAFNNSSQTSKLLVIEIRGTGAESVLDGNRAPPT